MLERTVSGGWKVRYRDGTRNAHGRLINRSSEVFATKALAAAYQRSIRDQQKLRRELGRTSNRAVMSLGAVLERYIEYRIAHGKMRTYYASELRDQFTHAERGLFVQRGWTSTSAVTLDEIDAWMRDKAGITPTMSIQERAVAMLAARGIDKKLTNLKTILRFARAHLRQAVDPAVLDMTKPKRPAKQKPPLLTIEQVLGIILPRARALGGEDLGEHLEGIIDHALTYGQRWLSLCLADVADFDASAKQVLIRHTKNGDPLVVHLLDEHVERYRRLTVGREPQAPLFLNPYGERWRCHAHGKATQLVSWYKNNIAPLLPPAQRQSYQMKDRSIAEKRRAGIPDETIMAIAGIKTRAVLDRYDTTNHSEVQLALHAMAALRAKQAEIGAPRVHPHSIQSAS